MRIKPAVRPDAVPVAPPPVAVIPPRPPPVPAPAIVEQLPIVWPASGALAPAETRVIAAPGDAPSFIEPTAEGLENSGDAGLMLPMLKLAQPLTPTVMSGHLKPGDVFLHLTPTETLIPTGVETNFIPLFHFKQWIEWAPREEGGGILGRSIDAQGELAARFARGEMRGEGDNAKLAVTEYHVFFIAFEGNLTEPVCLPLAKTAHKKGRLLLSLALRRGPKYPLYAGKYALSAMTETRNGNTYFNYDIKNAGWVTTEEYEVAKKLYRQFKEEYDKAALPLEEEETSVEAPASSKKDY